MKSYIYISFLLFSYCINSIAQTYQQGVYEMWDASMQPGIIILPSMDTEYRGHCITIKPSWYLSHGAKFIYSYKHSPTSTNLTPVVRYENGVLNLDEYGRFLIYDKNSMYNSTVITSYTIYGTTDFEGGFASIGVKNFCSDPRLNNSQVSFGHKHTEHYALSVGGPMQCSNFYNLSDERVKSNIKDLGTRVENLLSVDVRSLYKDSDESFNVKTEERINTEFELGKNIKDLYPELVSDHEDGTESINYIGFLPLLTETLKKQIQTVETNANNLVSLKDSYTTMLENSVNMNVSSTSVDFNIDLPFINSSIEIALYVHNIQTGQLVWKYINDGNTDISNKTISWNLKNLNGNKVPNGFYTYKLEVNTPNSHYNTNGKKFALK